MILLSLIAIAVILQVLDVLTTCECLARGYREGNPLVRYFMGTNIHWWIPKLGIAFVGITILAILPYGWIGFIQLNVIYTYVVYQNYRILKND